MTKHTPGPWKIFEGWGADKRRPVIVDAIPDVDGKFVGNCICYMASTNPDIEANAKMIAAAPEMFAACNAAMAVLSGECVDEVERWAPSGAAMNMLAAAIRKATKQESK